MYARVWFCTILRAREGEKVGTRVTLKLYSNCGGKIPVLEQELLREEFQHFVLTAWRESSCMKLRPARESSIISGISITTTTTTANDGAKLVVCCMLLEEDAAIGRQHAHRIISFFISLSPLPLLSELASRYNNAALE